MITRHVVKSCCGSRQFILEADKAIKKSQIQIFRDAGFLVPETFLNAGLFYVQKGFLIANASFGATKISVRCNGETCSSQIDAFIQLLEKAINS